MPIAENNPRPSPNCKCTPIHSFQFLMKHEVGEYQSWLANDSTSPPALEKVIEGDNVSYFRIVRIETSRIIYQTNIINFPTATTHHCDKFGYQISEFIVHKIVCLQSQFFPHPLNASASQQSGQVMQTIAFTDVDALAFGLLIDRLYTRQIGLRNVVPSA